MKHNPVSNHSNYKLTQLVFTKVISRPEGLGNYFLQHWTVDQYFARKTHNTIKEADGLYLIILDNGLDSTYLNYNPESRIQMSFRRRKQDDIGFVHVSLSHKEWGK